MSIKIGNYNFEGPFSSTTSLKMQSGVYVILGRNSATGNWTVVDIGESGSVRERIENHDRAPCWRNRGYQEIAVAVFYCNESQRMTIELQLRNQFNPPCGER